MRIFRPRATLSEITLAGVLRDCSNLECARGRRSLTVRGAPGDGAHGCGKYQYIVSCASARRRVVARAARRVRTRAWVTRKRGQNVVWRQKNLQIFVSHEKDFFEGSSATGPQRDLRHRERENIETRTERVMRMAFDDVMDGAGTPVQAMTVGKY